ncbi:MAG: hypothetical protein Ta2E_12850 [Mycoplasmoidaceae bacterium]|nr:MAG: hypothetical protein Ta2E_12850 [Mycoplasmoidaceae bacterium]
MEHYIITKVIWNTNRAAHKPKWTKNRWNIGSNSEWTRLDLINYQIVADNMCDCEKELHKLITVNIIELNMKMDEEAIIEGKLKEDHENNWGVIL